MTTRTTRSAARVPSSTRLLLSLSSRWQDNGDPIDRTKFVNDARGTQFPRVTMNGVLAAAKANGCEAQADDILREACGLKDVVTATADTLTTRPVAEPAAAEGQGDDKSAAGAANTGGDNPPPAASDADTAERVGDQPGA